MFIRHRFVDDDGIITDRWCEPGSDEAKRAVAMACFYYEYVRCFNDQTGEEFDLHPGWLRK